MPEATQSEYIVEVEDVYYSRGGKPIFKGLNIQFRRGEITAVMGPSGTGKTTLLGLVTGRLIPDRGRVMVNGHNISALQRERLYELRKHMGMLFQAGALLTDLNVFENVAFPLREHTRRSQRVRERRLPAARAHAPA